jgi:RimJ/RimL family protein N-acetyltransferase
MNPAWIVRTARLLMTPVGWADLPDLRAIKGEPLVFAVMLGGVRAPVQVAEDLARDVALWGARGYGMWAVRLARNGAFLGLTGLMERPDGRGIALRFAFWPEMQGRGLAREAAGSALRFGHDRAGLRRIVAVARETNFGSRMVLGGIGMVECGSFTQGGYAMVLYESIRPQNPSAPPGTRS